MSCCPGNIVPFAAVSSTNIGYSGTIPPVVQVVYFIDGVYSVNPHSNGVKFDNENIYIDHGGSASGFIVVK